MEAKTIQTKINKQRKFLETPIPLKKRKEALKKLRDNLKAMSPELSAALNADLGKCNTESYMTEIGLVLGEIGYMLKHMHSLAKKKRAHTPISNFPAKSYALPSAYGVVLIISPWNYPVLLSLSPLVDAIAAGNTVILKPSSNSVNVSKVLQKLLAASFDEAHATTILCNSKEDGNTLLDQEYDYIFYTGSTRVGHLVMEKAAQHFTPVTLEMGGKSPCIVAEDANLKLAAKRIVFGKLLNAGQTCVAPDYVYCHESVKDRLIQEISCEIVRQYTIDPLSNKNFPKIINQKQYDGLKSLLQSGKVVFGGKFDDDQRKIEPTIMSSTFKSEEMKYEIFGPILPVVTFKSIDEVIKNLRALPKPLALYIFSNNKHTQNTIISSCQFGGGCINDTIMHIANNHLGFGGLKQSGIGAYHGKVGFQTFSHQKSVVKKANWLDLPLRYQPFNKFKAFLIKLFLK